MSVSIAPAHAHIPLQTRNSKFAGSLCLTGTFTTHFGLTSFSVSAQHFHSWSAFVLRNCESQKAKLGLLILANSHLVSTEVTQVDCAIRIASHNHPSNCSLSAFAREDCALQLTSQVRMSFVTATAVQHIAESLAISNVTQDASKALAPHIDVRLREIVQVWAVILQ